MFKHLYICYVRVILKKYFAECDGFHFGRNCEQSCFCHHGVCNKIKGSTLFQFQYELFCL